MYTTGSSAGCRVWQQQGGRTSDTSPSHTCSVSVQDAAGLLDKFIKSPPVCCWDAAAPADYFIENGWCHHRVIDSSKECPLHPKGPELPHQMESALTFLIWCCSVISPVHCTCKMSPSQCPSPGVCRVVCICRNPPLALWSSGHWAGVGSTGTSPQSP